VLVERDEFIETSARFNPSWNPTPSIVDSAAYPDEKIEQTIPVEMSASAKEEGMGVFMLSFNMPSRRSNLNFAFVSFARKTRSFPAHRS